VQKEHSLRCVRLTFFQFVCSRVNFRLGPIVVIAQCDQPFFDQILQQQDRGQYSSDLMDEKTLELVPLADSQTILNSYGKDASHLLETQLDLEWDEEHVY